LILNRLNKAFPYGGNFSTSFKTFLFISGFITIFIFLFRSNQKFPDASTSYRLVVSLLYGIATFAGASFNTLILYLTISNKAQDNWKVWKHILLYLLHFFTITILLFFLNAFLAEGLSDLTFLAVVKSFSTTVLIGVIPVSIHVLYEQQKLYKNYYRQALEIEENRKKKEVVEEDISITIGENTLLASDILFLESDKNYVNIILKDNTKTTVRASLKELEIKLERLQQFLRCHRAYIINIDTIQSVEGNAQGLKLSVPNSLLKVPVSRSYIPAFSKAYAY